MRNPKDVLTKEGYEKYRVQLWNLREALFYITEHAGDLELDAFEHDDLMDLLAPLQLHLDENKDVLLGECPDYDYMVDEN